MYATVLIYLGDFGFAQHLYFESAAVVITLVMLGKYLEAVSKSKTSDAIKKLMNLRPQTAVIVKDGAELTVSLDEVVVGDVVLVRGKGWDVYSHGGRKNTGLDAVTWAVEMARRGAGEILLTSMDRDGTKSGFDLALTRAVSDAVSVPVIASGGVGTLDDLADGITKGGADAVLAASIFHYGEFTVGQAKECMARRGIPVRF